ncbi:MAG: hypothetical protein QM486_10970 [Flavobacteriaceae bacterium]
MSHLDFYKSIYDRELNRRKNLDDSISIPIGIISLLVGLISFFYSNKDYKTIIIENYFILFLFGISIILMTLSIIFIIKSYNNFLRGFNYPNISYLKNIRKLQTQDIPNYNQIVTKEKEMNFEKELVDKLIGITDTNTKINDTRAFDIYLAKTFIISSLSVLFITTIFLLIINSKLC